MLFMCNKNFYFLFVYFKKSKNKDLWNMSFFVNWFDICNALGWRGCLATMDNKQKTTKNQKKNHKNHEKPWLTMKLLWLTI